MKRQMSKERWQKKSDSANLLKGKNSKSCPRWTEVSEVQTGTPHPPLYIYTDTHIQRQTSWDGRSSEAPVTVRESMCWRGPPDAPSGPCQLSLAHWSSPGRDREERPWMEKAETASNMGQGQSNLHADEHRYCELLCCVCMWACGGERGPVREVIFVSKSSVWAAFLLLFPACSPCSVLSILLILPSPSSNHVFPHVFPRSFHLFHPLMCQFAHLWKSKEEDEEEKEGRREERAISGAAEVLINRIRLLTWWVCTCGCMRVLHVCVWLTERRTGRAGEQPEQHMLYISPIIITSRSLLIMAGPGGHELTDTNTQTHTETGFSHNYYTKQDETIKQMS